MDKEKLGRAADWIESVVNDAHILSCTNFELTDIGDGNYQVTFEREGAGKTVTLSAEYLEAIGGGDEAIREKVKAKLLQFGAYVKAGGGGSY